MATFNTAILSVPLILYEISFIYIHKNDFLTSRFILLLEKFDFTINLEHFS